MIQDRLWAGGCLECLQSTRPHVCASRPRSSSPEHGNCEAFQTQASPTVLTVPEAASLFLASSDSPPSTGPTALPSLELCLLVDCTARETSLSAAVPLADSEDSRAVRALAQLGLAIVSGDSRVAWALAWVSQTIVSERLYWSVKAR